MRATRIKDHVFWLAILLSASFAGSSLAANALPDFTRLVEENAPAVVNISTTQHIRAHEGGTGPDYQLPENSPFNELFRHFFEDRSGAPIERDSQSLGSGFIVSEDGYILTNYHVVDKADEINVHLSNRKTFEAKVIGVDEATDIALIKVDEKGLPTVKVGRSSQLKIGEWVLAIGSPFGFDHTVTAGIVSAMRRSLPSENYVPYIQTDVAINPGNSGGPLFNLDGEVVGINSQIFSRSGGFMGLSFAIPIELAMNVSDQLKTHGKVSRGYLGVLIQDVDRDLAESFGMDHPKGALVSKVVPNSPAQDAGVQVGDVILEFNGQELRDSSRLPPMVGTTAIGKKAELKVLRGGKTRILTVKIGKLPDENTVAQGGVEKPAVKNDRLGLTVDDLSAGQRNEAGITRQGGVVVTKINAGPAKSAGVREGDIILMLNGKQVTSSADFNSQLEKLPAGKSVAMLVHKQEGPVFLALRVPD